MEHPALVSETFYTSEAGTNSMSIKYKSGSVIWVCVRCSQFLEL